MAILGGGMVGAAISGDLAADPSISVAVMDKHEETLTAVRARHAVETRLVDLTEPDAIRESVAGFDLVVGALPGALGPVLTIELAVGDRTLRLCTVEAQLQGATDATLARLHLETFLPADAATQVWLSEQAIVAAT